MKLSFSQAIALAQHVLEQHVPEDFSGTVLFGFTKGRGRNAEAKVSFGREELAELLDGRVVETGLDVLDSEQPRRSRRKK